MISGERQAKHKGGRPKTQVCRTVTSLRLTKAERYIIKNKAVKAGMAVTAYIRQMAIHGKVSARLSEEEGQFVRELVGISNNLNQLAKKANAGQFLSAILEFEKYRNIIDELLEKLRK
ncbi:MAG: MobC family plasmid mobilization relaxosome protein [Bacteroidota bacterium]|nr:MobC family plasmid mobilization relaxosome protein [Bacteroidota bacterium]